MPKKFNVVWTEHYKCTATVEAESEEAAIEACYDIDNNVIAGKIIKEYEGTSDWSAEETDGSDK